MGFSFEAPQTKPGSAYREKETITTHPAYGQIAASRVQGGTLLYGSDFQHQHYMTITIRRSELHRDLSRDWPSARDELIAVALSEAQWATFISTPNSGQGVQCTLQHIDCKPVPQIPYVRNTESTFKDELRQTLGLVESSLKDLESAINNVGLSGKKQKELMDFVDTARRNLAPNLSFVADQFSEHIEDVTEHAKIEVEAYIQGAISRAGVAALSGPSPLTPGLIEGPVSGDPV